MKRFIASLLTAALAVFCFCVTSSAAEKPAAPTNILYKLESPNTVRIKWNNVSGAKKYYIYKYIDRTGEYKKFCETAKTGMRFTDLTPEREYKLAVAAVVGGNVGELGKVSFVTPTGEHYLWLSYDHYYNEEDNKTESEFAAKKIVELLERAGDNEISNNIRKLGMTKNQYFAIFAAHEKELNIYDNGYMYFTLVDNYNKEAWETCLKNHQKPSYSEYYDDDDDCDDEPESFNYWAYSRTYGKNRNNALLFRYMDRYTEDKPDIEFVGRYDLGSEDIVIIDGIALAVKNETFENSLYWEEDGCEDECDDDEEKTEEQLDAERRYAEQQREYAQQIYEENLEKAKKLTSTVRISDAEKPFFSKQHCEITDIVSDDKYLYFLVKVDEIGYSLGALFDDSILGIDHSSYIYRVNKDGTGLKMLHRFDLNKYPTKLIGVDDGYLYISNYPEKNKFICRIPADNYSKKLKTVVKNCEGHFEDACIKNGVLYFKTEEDYNDEDLIESELGVVLDNSTYYNIWNYFSYDLKNDGEAKKIYSLKFEDYNDFYLSTFPLSKEIDNDYIITCIRTGDKGSVDKFAEYYACRLDGSRSGYVGRSIWREKYSKRYIPTFWR